MSDSALPPAAPDASDPLLNIIKSPTAVVSQAIAIASGSGEQENMVGANASSDSMQPPSHLAALKGSEGIARLNQSEPSAESAQQAPAHEVPRPAYSKTYGQVDFSQEGFDTKARIASDGRVNININQKSRQLSELLVPALRSQLKLHHVYEQGPDIAHVSPLPGGYLGQTPPPPMNIVIHVVGSRGDVQPFIALGKRLKETHGHRVRLATHPNFKEFVEENSLEFFSIGGDPAELMAFMVKNPGLMPGIDSLRAGDIGKRRKGMYEIIQGCWRSCIEAGDGTGIRASDDHLEGRSSLDSGIGMDSDPSARPFVADAIIANPPSFAHVHCAEKLGIPLHLMFTMPWSPTQAFPHPLANVQSSNADASVTNFVSYALVEMMTWQGLGDIINRFREDSLGLEPVSLMWAPGMASRLRIPYTYCWSPALIPKPKDWGSHITISGFYFLSLAANFTPEPELAAFLDAGPPPIYIGFGSIVVDDPNAMTKLIFVAIQKTGQRALVSKGWGGLGADAMGIPEGVFMLGNVPHDWLFKHVSCVVHHGGAGTTAAGIATGKPTVVVPFFGDQPFWGAMVAKAGAGPLPIPSKHLTSDNLAAAILEALKPKALERAKILGASINSELGTEVGAQSFHEKLGVDALRCTLAPNRTAAWRIKRTNIRLSPFVATVLGNEGLLDFSDLKLYRPIEYDSEDGPWDPITGGASALLGTLGSLAMGFADFPIEVFKAFKVKSAENTKVVEKLPLVSRSDNLQSRPDSPVAILPNMLDSCRIPDRTNSVNQNSAKSNEIPDRIEKKVESVGISHSQELLESQKVKGHHDHHRLNSPFVGLLHRNATPNGQGEPAPKNRVQGGSVIDVSSKSLHRSLSGNSQAGQISLDAALGAGKGIGRIVGAGLKSPMDFTLSLARGFHNAPKLYGDESVRHADKITGIQSGLKAAGKEFGLGFYDGISGLVTQPFEGAKKEGVAGLIKGFGKGIGGVVLKPGAAIWGLPGYTFMGIYKELQKQLGSSSHNYIVAARTAQGYEEWRSSSLEERLDVVSQWHSIQIELDKEKQQARHNSFHAHYRLLKTRNMSFDDRNKISRAKKAKKEGERKKARAEDYNRSEATSNVLHHARTYPSASTAYSDAAAFEEAIQNSVAATSQGNPEQDKLIERAIRASVLELRSAAQEGDNNEALQRAIQASIVEATRTRNENMNTQSPLNLSEDLNHEEQLRDALKRSINMHDEIHPKKHQCSISMVDFDDSDVNTDDDDNIKAAIEQSKKIDIV